MLSLNGNGANCKVMPTQVSQVLYTFLFLHWLDSIQGRIFIQTLSPLWISCPIFFFMATYSSVPILCLFIFPQEKRRERKISHAFFHIHKSIRYNPPHSIQKHEVRAALSPSPKLSAPSTKAQPCPRPPPS